MKHNPLRTVEQAKEEQKKKWRNVAAWCFVLGFFLLFLICYAVKILVFVGIINLLKN